MEQPSATGQPNVLLILADDMGYSDIGCFGSEIRTPNIDALAARGVRFSQFYNAARCCPSRASLLTGLYPHQTGLGHMVRDRGAPSYQGYLNGSCVTLGEMLRDAGYFTGYAGKWHVGGFWDRSPRIMAQWRYDDPTHPIPTHRGFDLFYGSLAGGGYFNPTVHDQDHLIETPEDFYSTDAWTDAALRIMDQAGAAKKPFFVHVCYNAPHWPLHAPAEDIERYRGRYADGWDVLRGARHEEIKSLGVLPDRWALSPRDPEVDPWDEAPNKDWNAARMEVYAAMVDRMDQNIGRMIEHLRTRGELDNTLIIFLSDNGGSAEFLQENGWLEREMNFTKDGRPVRIGNIVDLPPGGSDTFMSYGRAWASVSNAPFRLFKSWVHEGGISTPLIMAGPGVEAGGVTHAVSHLVDLAATITDLSGATYPAEYRGTPITPLQGESFAPLLRGQDWRRTRPVYFEHEGNKAVRDGEWKLVLRHPERWELYNMHEDRTELNDLASKDTDRAQRMAAMWNEWADECGVLPWEEVRRAEARSSKWR